MQTPTDAKGACLMLAGLFDTLAEVKVRAVAGADW
jgi:hypothetical protein